MNDNPLIDKLRAENERLQQIAAQDELTGVSNRRAVEQMISETMSRGGALLVCDLDYFKKINDRYGHLKGDQCLQKTVEILSYSIRQEDALGRIGGDEFVIFAYGKQSAQTIDIIRTKIYRNFKTYSLQAEIPLMLTVGGTVWQEGDTYETMFARADRELLELKQRKHVGREISDTAASPWIHDLKMIQSELVEQMQTPYGSNCQDYETFKMIYRFLERCMKRSEQKVCLLLLSFADENGETGPYSEISRYMQKLGDILMSNLRLGDVYTRYSSCQYLVLLIDVDKQTAENVAARLRKCFSEQVSMPPENRLLMHYCSELEPIHLL